MTEGFCFPSVSKGVLGENNVAHTGMRECEESGRVVRRTRSRAVFGRSLRKNAPSATARAAAFAADAAPHWSIRATAAPSHAVPTDATCATGTAAEVALFYTSGF